MNHLYILLTILLTVYGQIVIKWQVKAAGELPNQTEQKIQFILNLLLNPWIVSSLICAFLASLFWMAAMTKFPLSYAYPFTSLSFLIILLASNIFFQEAITINKLVGISCLITGIIISSKG
jgi:multidrug transporter EmrE-like cation transporter